MGVLNKVLYGEAPPRGPTPLTPLYNELGVPPLQRHLGVNGVYTTWNVGRLIFIYQTGTNTTHHTLRAVLAIHKTSVLVLVTEFPIRLYLLPLPSLTPPPEHTHLDSATQGKQSDYDWNFKLSSHVKSRPRKKMIVPVSVVSDKTVIDSDYISGLYSPGRSRLFHPLLKSLCSFLF